MKRSFLPWFCSLVAASAFAGDSFLVYFGTYTNGESKGVYRATFDASTGALSSPELAAEEKNPSFVAVAPSNTFLYSVSEGGGGVTAFRIDRPSGTLTKLNSVATVGKGACHVNVDSTERVLGIANYNSGSAVSYKVSTDGSLSEAVSVQQHEGSSVNPKRQAGPHAHSFNFSADGRFAYVCDLGLDQVLIYQVDGESGKLTPAKAPFVRTPQGGGPRHLAIHPNGRFVFVNNEMTRSVSVFSRDAETGALELLDQTVSTLPEGDPPAGSTAETVVHPNGKFVYVSNRGHDTIAVFSCDPESGALKLIQNAPAQGKTPRNFCLDPTGKWMIVAHQGSNTVAVLKVDPETGKLSPTDVKQSVGSPVCVRFVALD